MSTLSTQPAIALQGAVIFDTNAYRVLTYGRTLAETRAITSTLLEKEKSQSITAYAHPIVIWELFTHLADPADRAYQNCLHSVVSLGEHTALADKNGAIRMIGDSYTTATLPLFGLIPPKYEQALLALTTVVTHIVKKAPDLSDPVCQKNILHLSQAMSKMEANWLKGMESVVDQFSPGNAKAVFGGTSDKDVLNKVRAYFSSEAFFLAWSYAFLIDRAASVGILSFSDHEMSNKAKMVREIFAAPFHLLRTLLLKLALPNPVDLSNPKKKRWNFIWDSMIAFSIGPGSIAQEPVYLVTGDGEITDAGKEANFGTHVLSLEDYLRRIGMTWTPITSQNTGPSSPPAT